jgi:hypothetical protein
MLYPNERAYLDLFDEVVLSTNDPLSLFPVSTGSVHVATAAGRARVLMMGQRLPEAIELIARVVDVAPDLPYLHWVKRWLQPAILPSLAWDLLFPSIVKTALTMGIGVPVPPSEDDRRIPNLRAAVEIFGALKQQFPQESVLFFGEALLRRRLGEPEETVAAAEDGVQRFPEDARMRTALMNAYRDAGRPDDALMQAREAMRIDPGDFAPLHDAAWAFIEANRFDEAARLFDELIHQDPQYPGAKACMHYARFKAFGAPEDRDALVRLREREWWDDRVRGFADEAEPPVPYVNVLPGPGDATCAAARHLVVELGHVIRCCGAGGHLSLGLHAEHLDSPSVGLAFDLAMRTLGASGTLNVEVAEIQQPDPRIEKAQASTPVWRLEGEKLVKVHAEGDPSAQEAIASIARQVFRRETWDPAAKAVADRFGAQGYHALLSVMTNPSAPKDEDGFDVFNWTWRCQVAAAVTLSHLGPWETGSARAALYSLAYGPSDWTTGAALIAFAWRVMENPALRPEVEPIFQWLRTQIPEKGFTAWEIVLADAWLAMGGHTDHAKADLDEWIDRYFATLHEKNRVGPPERRYGGLTLEDYARFSAHRDKMISALGYGDPLTAAQQWIGGAPSPDLERLCKEWNVDAFNPATGGFYPWIPQWQEALNASPDLFDRFREIQRTIELESFGVSTQEKAALDQIHDGQMDMHLRMAQQQQAQREVNEGGGGDPDPVVFPGHPVEKLSDYVGILKGMQTGDMMGALARYGLDMMSYGSVAQAWGAKMAADPVLTEKFNRMMQG